MIAEERYPKRGEVLSVSKAQTHQLSCSQHEGNLKPWKLTSHRRKTTTASLLDRNPISDAHIRSFQSSSRSSKIATETSTENRSDIIGRYTEDGHRIDKSTTVPHRPQEAAADSDVKKREWLQRYSRHLLDQWFKWQTPLGVALTYAAQIREDLAAFYEDPLKRTFIETTYDPQLLDRRQH